MNHEKYIQEIARKLSARPSSRNLSKYPDIFAEFFWSLTNNLSAQRDTFLKISRFHEQLSAPTSKLNLILYLKQLTKSVHNLI